MTSILPSNPRVFLTSLLFPFHFSSFSTDPGVDDVLAILLVSAGHYQFSNLFVISPLTLSFLLTTHSGPSFSRSRSSSHHLDFRKHNSRSRSFKHLQNGDSSKETSKRSKYQSKGQGDFSTELRFAKSRDQGCNRCKRSFGWQNVHCWLFVSSIE